jgi:hypothetical protein
MTIRTHAANDAYRSGWDAAFGGREKEPDALTNTQKSRAVFAQYDGGCLSVLANDWGMDFSEACEDAADSLRGAGWLCISPKNAGAAGRTLAIARVECRKLLPHLPASPESHVAIPLWALRALVGAE